MKVTHLFTYCLKSSRGLEQQSVICKTTGFLNDRTVAVIDSDNKIITGREHPQLLRFSSKIDNATMEINYDDSERYTFQIPKAFDSSVEVRLFRNNVHGHLFSEEANEMVSKLLEGSFRLIYMGNSIRPLLPKRGGKEGEFTAYADSSPVHLINLKTLEYLNSKLKKKVSLRHFRPNIVIDGGQAFEEDTWANIDINGHHFRVQEKTQRCIFTTIDPETYSKNKSLQPLAMIAKIRAKSGSRPTFGINMVPMMEGTINMGDSVKIIKTF